MPTRRDVLAGLAGLGVAAAGVDTAAAASAPYGPQPEFVTLTGYGADPSVDAELEYWRPALVLRTLDIRPTKLYCWKARSTERETDMYCYWAWYPAGQEGVTEEDSHVPDREPIYVEVDGETRDLVAVHYDEIHYSVGTNPAPTQVDGSHPSLHVVNPWHNYRPTTETGTAESPPLADLHAVYGGWIRSGWSVHLQSVVNPWTVLVRGHWWPNTVAGLSVNAMLTDIADAPVVGPRVRQT